MKLAAVVSVLNQFPIAKQTVKYLLETGAYDVYVMDNGSDEEFSYDDPRVKVVRCEEPLGSYPIFFEALNIVENDVDIIAFFHSDFFVYEKGWADKVIAQFEKDSKLGMIGFIGSNEIDIKGGRGLGTASNFQGKITKSDCEYNKYGTPIISEWYGSPAEIHGRRLTGFMNAVVVDGCSMILRRTALMDIEERPNFPPHHFYDKLISTQLLEKGYHIGVLGIECDHISGQTVNQEKKYQEMAKRWCIEHHVSPGGIGVNWDTEVYKEAERQWLGEYRDVKHFIPIQV